MSGLLTMNRRNEIRRMLERGDISDLNEALDIIEEILPSPSDCALFAKTLFAAFYLEDGKDPAFLDTAWASDSKTRNLYSCVGQRLLFPGQRKDGEG